MVHVDDPEDVGVLVHGDVALAADTAHCPEQQQDEEEREERDVQKEKPVEDDWVVMRMTGAWGGDCSGLDEMSWKRIKDILVVIFLRTIVG